MSASAQPCSRATSRDAICSRLVSRGRHDRLRAEGVSGTDNEQIVGCNEHFAGLRGAGALIHPLDHRLAADGQQSLSRRRDDAYRAGITTRNIGGPASTIQQRIVGGQLPGLFLQHHRNIVPNGVGQAIHAAHQHVGVTLKFERALTDRTGEYFQPSGYPYSAACGGNSPAGRNDRNMYLKKAVPGLMPVRREPAVPGPANR